MPISASQAKYIEHRALILLGQIIMDVGPVEFDRELITQSYKGFFGSTGHQELQTLVRLGYLAVNPTASDVYAVTQKAREMTGA